MASILRVDTLTDASSNNSIATSNVFSGTAKHFSVIKGTDTFGTTNSFNQSGATDHATGDHTVTHTNNFSDADGSPPMVNIHNTADGGSNDAVGVARGGGHGYLDGEVAPSASSIRVNTSRGSTGSADGTALDFSSIYITRHGDLA